MSPTRATGRARSARGGRRFVRWGALVAVVAVAAGVALGVAQVGPFGDTIRELTLPLRHDDIIRQQSRDKGVDPDLIAAVIYTESRFRNQTSEAGARGLMQITPATADVIERLSGGETFITDDLSDPDINIRYGTFYLRYLLDRYGGNEVAALAAYNAGQTNADAWGGAELDLDRIQFPETRDYVRQVREKRREYRRGYAEELGLE